MSVTQDAPMILDTLDIASINHFVLKHHIEIIISDLFDTILCRRVHPEQIKKIVAARLSDCFDGISELEFYQLRQKAEAFCIEQSKVRHGEQEIRYFDLIKTLHGMLKDRHGEVFKIEQNVFYQQYLHMELAAECRNVCVDFAMVDCLRQHKKNGKKIILLSDFHMSGRHVESILTHCKISDIYDHLVVSSDYLKTKRSGTLYQHLIDSALIDNPHNTLMMGDNEYSDIQMANQFHFKTFFIDRRNQKRVYAERLKISSSYNALISQIKKLMVGEHQLDVFEHSALLLLQVIRKLFAHCLQQGVKDLYFLSREGQIVKTLFDHYQDYVLGKHRGNHRVRSHYLLVSRRSTAAASLSPLACEDFQALFRQYSRLSIKQFAMSYGFDSETIAVICKALNIDSDEIQAHFPSSDVFRQLKNHPRFMTHYEDTRTIQRANFISYFQTCCASDNNAPIFIFDVGWKGTIQDNLAKIFKERAIIGYYLGLLSAGTMTAPSQKQGLLFDYRNKDKDYWIYRENWPFFEILLSASHGYVKGYHRQASGLIDVELDNNEIEQQVFSSRIAPLHQKIQAQFKQLLLLFDDSALGIQSIEHYLSAYHEKKIFSPREKETHWFFDMPHYENFGAFTHFDFSGCEARSLAKKIKQLMIFLKSPRRYIASPLWPSARFKRNGLSMVVPLYKWYTLYFKRLLER